MHLLCDTPGLKNPHSELRTGTSRESSGVEKQAIGRAYRQGQCKSVQVIRFVAKGTVEEEQYKLTIGEAVDDSQADLVVPESCKKLDLEDSEDEDSEDYE
eukprot:TRINITY_DN1608_c0_g1_i10.p3 TRINITY_DN1608_c0_g1~~TRINITY_DN1608_c0_g1_i10.p3  ORF type:complete len:100 (+),score=16.26 TRINITY_DN1608_c0_g1_i10:1672-1971(+)